MLFFALLVLEAECASAAATMYKTGMAAAMAIDSHIDGTSTYQSSARSPSPAIHLLLRPIESRDTSHLGTWSLLHWMATPAHLARLQRWQNRLISFQQASLAPIRR